MKKIYQSYLLNTPYINKELWDSPFPTAISELMKKHQLERLSISVSTKSISSRRKVSLFPTSQDFQFSRKYGNDSFPVGTFLFARFKRAKSRKHWESLLRSISSLHLLCAPLDSLIQYNKYHLSALLSFGDFNQDNLQTQNKVQNELKFGVKKRKQYVTIMPKEGASFCQKKTLKQFINLSPCCDKSGIFSHLFRTMEPNTGSDTSEDYGQGLQQSLWIDVQSFSAPSSLMYLNQGITYRKATSSFRPRLEDITLGYLLQESKQKQEPLFPVHWLIRALY